MTKLYVNPMRPNDPPYKSVEDLDGYELIPTHWHSEDEDLVWVDVPEKPELSRYLYYGYLEDWSIK